MTNCFEVRIGLIAFLLAASIGMLWNIAYGAVSADGLNGHGFHVTDLMQTTRVLYDQCFAQMKLQQETPVDQQDLSIWKSCINFFESLDKHMTTAYNESASDVNAIKSTIGGGLVTK